MGMSDDLKRKVKKKSKKKKHFPTSTIHIPYKA